MGVLFFLQNVGLGAGLAMDACAVSMTNGLREPKMPVRKILLIAFMFGFFQAAMPILGYFVGHALLRFIGALIPWLALIILVLLGAKMIFDGLKERGAQKTGTADNAAKAQENETAADDGESSRVATAQVARLAFPALLVQALATSIDALSVGVTIAAYSIAQALVAALIIALVTFGICVGAVFIGKKFGDRLGYKAVILGGAILIAIGLEIFLTGIL